jgi:hypothetical protein
LFLGEVQQKFQFCNPRKDIRSKELALSIFVALRKLKHNSFNFYRGIFYRQNLWLQLSMLLKLSMVSSHKQIRQHSLLDILSVAASIFKTISSFVSS